MKDFFDFLNSVKISEPNVHRILSEENYSPLLISPFEVVLSQNDFRTIHDFILLIQRIRRNPKYRVFLSKVYPDRCPVDPLNYSLFMSYDFHLTEAGPKIIEINTNASGASTAELIRGVKNNNFPVPFVENFYNDLRLSILQEYQLSGVPRPLHRIAIVDETPMLQKAYYEFRIYKEKIESWGFQCEILDINDIEYDRTKDSLVSKPSGEIINFVYNRSTDFYFSNPQSHALATSMNLRTSCISPHPHEYFLLGEKDRLIHLRSEDLHKTLKLTKDESDLLKSVILESHILGKCDKFEIWSDRKKYFFKPISSYGGKAVYRGSSISRRTFDDIFLKDYIAQELAETVPSSTPMGLYKYDIRFYCYQDRFQSMAARLYQGQLTNFRVEGGGFATVRIS